MIFLRQSTASQEVPLGRFVDSTDGNTEETALSIANTDIKIWKTGATTLASKNSGGATHIANGEYYCVLDATDTDTIGPLKITIHVAGALYVQVYCTVLDEAVYDSLFGTTALSTYAGADTSGTTTLLSRIGTPSNLGGGATVAANLSDIEAQTDDIGAAGAGLTALGDTRLANLDAAITTRAVAGDAMALTSGERTTLAAAIWNALTSGMTTVGSIGKKLADWVIHSAADVWAVGSRVLTAGTNIVLAKGTGVTGFNDLSAAQVNAECDTAISDAALATAAELAAVAADLPHRYTRAVAVTGFTFFMRDSTTHAAATGLTVTAQRSIDGGALGACANTVSEIGNGLYKITLATTDMDGVTIALRFTATGADDLVIILPTQPT